MEDIRKCRVCDDPELVGYMGLCGACHVATTMFWRSRRYNFARRGKLWKKSVVSVVK